MTESSASQLLADIHPVETIGATDEPLLTAVLLPHPNPLLASAPATLTLVISNRSRELATVGSFVVTLPIGTTAKTLSASTAGIGTQVPAGWSATQSGNVFTLTPTPTAAEVGAHGLAFIFTGITVNDEVGTCTVILDENASSRTKPSARRTTSIVLTKFPPTFALSDLTVSDASVGSDGSVVLMWSGSAATYTLRYDPTGNGATSHAVRSFGPYTATDLTAPVVVFTLTATLAVPGEDQPLVFQRQAVVTVVRATVRFTALPTIIAPSGVTRLEWQTTGATSCTLDPGNLTLPANGYAYVVLATSQTLSLTAIEAGTGRAVVQQQTVTTNPAIVPTATDAQVGTPGRAGDNGTDNVTVDGYWGRPGHPGGPVRGYTALCGPLDTSSRPQKVVRIVYSGGPGGRGGNAGKTLGGLAGGGGDGGAGGETDTLTIRIDPALPAQQLIVDLTPGPGGAGGNGGPGRNGTGPPGTRGATGRVGRLRFDEVRRP